VSNFTIERKEETKVYDHEIDEEEVNLSSSLMEDEFEGINEEELKEKHGIEEVLSFIENQVDVISVVSNETKSNSSSDENYGDEINKKKKKRNLKIHKYHIQKKILKIGIRLRSFLKETSIFNYSNFDSILNENKLGTPLSKINTSKQPMPSIIKNFFKDESIVEEAKKRYSLKESQLKEQFSIVRSPEEIYTCKSAYNNFSYRKNYSQRDNLTNITNFTYYLNGEDEKSSSPLRDNSNAVNFNLSQRGSIFKEGFKFDYRIVEEPNEEVEGEKSDEDSPSNSNGEK
jgi:hypothetical protein